MLKFCYSLAPYPMKVALFLEEAGLPYEAIAVQTRKAEMDDDPRRAARDVPAERAAESLSHRGTPRQ